MSTPSIDGQPMFQRRVLATEENRELMEALLGFKLPDDLSAKANGIWMVTTTDGWERE